MQPAAQELINAIIVEATQAANGLADVLVAQGSQSASHATHLAPALKASVGTTTPTPLRTRQRVGLFCPAPRKVAIRSRAHMAVIDGDGWSGEPVDVADDPEPIEGTSLSFEDDAWSPNVVKPQAVFYGLNVTVDGKDMECLPFVSESARHDPELACRSRRPRTGAGAYFVQGPA